jgi:hypothetical protein
VKGEKQVKKEEQTSRFQDKEYDRKKKMNKLKEKHSQNREDIII